MIKISLSNVSLYRDGRPLLKEINWRVTDKEHWAVVGANGCGKTLLLKLISGYLWPSDGSVEVLGYRFGEADLRELRRAIGWVSLAIQLELLRPIPAIDVVLSGYFSSIGFYEPVSDELRIKAEELMADLGLLEFRQRPFNSLSYGEQKRTLIARALINEPEILILDEPCTGLDLAVREQFLSTLRGLAQRPDGPNIILVTHHVEEIIPEISNCLLMKEGSVLNQGSKKAVLTASSLSECLSLPIRLREQNDSSWGYRYWSELS